ncbi:acetyl-CoA synthetase-like protein [Mycena alexandri]|uniref:Acetyl-CoA synthetase-like protein n=1 Tax=Mycena alexandri TaxID=1745969 RepID=A0AAD6XDL7_9AGAR|nr:acetyl-CoA synthetase-like protein [Mycena alexandri]
MSNPMRPPVDCSLNLEEIINLHIARENSSAAYVFADEESDVTEITHLEFARAAHRVAHILRPQRGGPERQVLAITALTDVLIYQTIVAGCIIAGIVPFQISHRNSTAAIFQLLNNTSSHRMLTTKGSLAKTMDALSTYLATQNPPYQLFIEEIPLLGHIYPHLGHETTEDPFVPYPGPTTRTALDEVAMYVHSSGSTGFPKSIPLTHRFLIQYAAMELCAQTIELSPRHAVGALPAFHSYGMLVQLCNPILAGGTACIYPLASTATEYVIPVNPTPQNALENARRTKATGISAVPAFLVEWQSSEHIAYLKTLNLLMYGGGPLPPRVGDFLFSQGINVVPGYGGSEFGGPIIIKREPAEVAAGEWAWFRFSNRSKIRWMPQADGTFECQFLSVPETHQMAVENLSDVKGYATKDLFERHPTKPDLYRIVGRLDDVLIMANGEKTVPGPMENIMMASPLIKGAVMFGRERNQVGVLVEPNTQHTLDPADGQQLANFRNLIWPVVEEANETAPAFARIYKEMILVTDAERPMIRTPKKTIVKKATVALYQKDIEDLYFTIEASGDAASDVEPPLSWTPRDLQPWLQTQASLVADRDLRDDSDLFEQGFDSLNATFLRHRIVGGLHNSTDEKAKKGANNIPQNFVYNHPSVGELAKAISALVNGDGNGTDEGKSAIIEEMIAKYSEGFNAGIVERETKAASIGAVMFLTGSTGGLGTHLLQILLNLASVRRVYAFNRRGKVPLAERQKAAFLDRGLDAELLSSDKLVYLEGDATSQNLGLPFDVWTEVRDTITVIIHNAWMLDFNKSLSSFEPHVKGTRNLIDLARQGANNSGVRFMFTSSIGTGMGWDPNRGQFPEELQPTADAAIGSGYSESKYVSERILAASGLEATSFRIGQITGSSSNGAWSTTDWVPVIVKSSIALGSFPSDASGVVSWLPPEAIAEAIIDVALSAEKPAFAINLVHPRPIAWDAVISTMAGELPLIPFASWVQRLQDRSVGATAKDIENIPAIKLLAFFKAMVAGAVSVEFSTAKAQAASESMRLLKPLREQDVQRWMHYWRQKEFLN